MEEDIEWKTILDCYWKAQGPSLTDDNKEMYFKIELMVNKSLTRTIVLSLYQC